MSTREVFMAGLPGAGKTSFIAALWQQIYSCDDDATELAFDSIEGLDVNYLNQLRFTWLQANKPERTKLGHEKTAILNLRSKSGDVLKLSLEDFAGEGFRQMWTRRRALAKIADVAQRSDRHLLIVNIGAVIYPRTSNELAREVGADQQGSQTEIVAPAEEAPFDPRKCPTAPQLTDVLQQLLRTPIGAKPRKVAVALTAWDEVANEGLSPDKMLWERLPLLAQFIDSLADLHEFRVFGVSAQGGSYEDEASRARVLATENQSDRIVLIDGDDHSHDLTRMLGWLLE